MNLQYGDIIQIDNDSFDTIGKSYEVMSVEFRENSTATKLVLKDTNTKEVSCIIVAKNQIIRDTDGLD